MTEPSDEAGPESGSTAGTSRPATAGAAGLGLFRFTIEGRAAPGLFVAGWIAVLVGGSAGLVGALAGRNLAGTLLFVLGLAVVLVALILLGGSQSIERRQAGAAYAGPSPLLALGAVVTGWYLAAIAIVTPMSLLGLRVAGPALSLLGVAIQALVVLAMLRLMVVGGEALTWGEMGWTRPSAAALREVARGAVYAVPVIVVTALVVALLEALIRQQPASPLPPTGTSAGLLLNLLTGALIAPVYEELFFRGFALTAWRRTGSAGRAVLRSAVLFAAVHAIDQSGATFGEAAGIAIVAAGARFPVALALGFLFERRRSLWAAIGLHATFNGLLIIIAERALSG